MSTRVATALVAAMLLLSGGVAAIDALATPVPAAAPEPVAQGRATAGVWYCPMTGGEDDLTVLSVAAAGQRPARVTVVRYTPEGPVAADPLLIDPGELHEVALSAEQSAQPLAVRWSGGPATASVRLQGPTGMAAAPCAEGPQPQWFITGLDTAAGSSALLHLHNPFTTDAVVEVAFATADGRIDLMLTDSVLVPAQSAVRLDLGQFEPERMDLGVALDVRSGRLVAAGEVRMDPLGEQEGPTGRALLAAAPATSLTWGFADARQGEAVDSWVTVMNPGDRDAAVEVRVSEPLPDGGALFGEVTVPAGGVVRLPLGDTSTASDFGVSLTVVNEVGVVAALVSDIRGQAGRDLTAATGAPQPARQWALVGAGTVDRPVVVAVHNPGAEPATVSLTAPGAPEPWQEVTVGANARVAFPLGDMAETAETADVEAEGQGASVPVGVQADRPVVAQLRTATSGGDSGAWSTAGVPSAAWTGPARRPAVLRDPTLSRRSTIDAGIDSGIGP